MAKVHLCLVSDQPLPILLPVLDPDWRPDMVILLVSPKMRKNGKAALLREVLAELVEVKDVDLADLQPVTVREHCRSILQHYESEGHEVWLNLTCGTKVMAVNAFQIFSEVSTRPILYVDTEMDRYQRLDNDGAWPMKENLLSLRHYLAVYGFTISKQGVEFPAAWLQVARKLGERADDWRDEFSQFSQVGKEGGTLSTKTPTAMLDLLVEAGVGAVTETAKGFRLTLTHPDALDFLQGGWLEALVADQVSTAAGVHHVGRSVEIARIGREGGNPDAELDVAFLLRNRLHIVECGAGKKGSDALFKLTSRREVVGGTFARGMMVAVRPDSDSKRRTLEEAEQHARQRASDLGVELVLGHQFKELEARVTAWLTPKQ